MNAPNVSSSPMDGPGGGARLRSLARGVAEELDLVDVILIVGPPMVAAVLHLLGNLVNSYVELEEM